MTTNIMWLVIAALIVILLVYYRKRKQAEHVPVAYDPEIEAPKNTVTDAIANAKNKFSRSAGLDRPRSSDTVITKVVDTAESAARSCPGGAKDMPSAIHVTMSRPQFEYVGKYLAEIRDHSTSGIRQRAREHGWPTPTTTVTIAVDDELAAPLRISTRFDTPFPQLGRATAKFTDQPAETVIEPRPSHDENPTPLLSDWQLILPNKTIVRLELNRRCNERHRCSRQLRLRISPRIMRYSNWFDHRRWSSGNKPSQHQRHKRQRNSHPTVQSSRSG